MIKLAKKGLLSVALLATVVAKASKIVTVNSPGAKVVNITFSQVSQGEKFSIVNANGNILLEEVLNKAESYVKTINFSPLKEGIYFLETKKEKEVKVTPIFIKSNSVNIATGLTKTYSAPKISTDGNLIHLLVKNFDKSSVSVSISDKNGKYLNTHNSAVNFTIRLIFLTYMIQYCLNMYAKFG